MTEIEKKALALVNEVLVEWGVLKKAVEVPKNSDAFARALLRAIEQHEAYKQEVSDAVKDLLSGSVFYQSADVRLRRFIIPKPPVDPLAFALADWEGVTKPGPGYYHDAKVLREALAKRGLKIVETGQ